MIGNDKSVKIFRMDSHMSLREVAKGLNSITELRATSFLSGLPAFVFCLIQLKCRGSLLWLRDRTQRGTPMHMRRFLVLQLITPMDPSIPPGVALPRERVVPVFCESAVAQPSHPSINQDEEKRKLPKEAVVPPSR